MDTKKRKFPPFFRLGQFSFSRRLTCLLGLAHITVIMMFPGTSISGDQPLSFFRVGFSAPIFSEVNQNDALAAVKVWANTIVNERKINANPQPVIFNSLEEISDALINKTIECISLTAIEYASLRELLDDEVIIVGVVSGAISEEYVLVAQRRLASGGVINLKGSKLTINQTARTCLAPHWLDNVLIEKGLSPATDFFQQIRFEKNIGKAVLPVFFQQQDVCLVTRRGLQTMIELNPQIGERLQVLAVSDPVIPHFFCFRAGFNGPVRDRLMEEITSWHTTPSGQQILTIFQTDRLEAHPVAILKKNMEIMVDHLNIIK